MTKWNCDLFIRHLISFILDQYDWFNKFNASRTISQGILSFQLQLSSSKMMKINLYFDVIWVPLYLWQPILTHMWFHSSNFRRIDYLISKNKLGYRNIKQNMIYNRISLQSSNLSHSNSLIYESYFKLYSII